MELADWFEAVLMMPTCRHYASKIMSGIHRIRSRRFVDSSAKAFISVEFRDQANVGPLCMWQRSKVSAWDRWVGLVVLSMSEYRQLWKVDCVSVAGGCTLWQFHRIRLPIEQTSDVGHRFDFALGMCRLVVLVSKLEQSQMPTIHTWFFFMGADACLVVACM